MTSQVTILGASARAAAFSAIAAGLQPWAIDLFADRDLAAACPVQRIHHYPHDFLAALAATPDCPWIYTGGLENYPRLIERLAAIRPLWGNRGAGLRGVRDPRRLASVVEQAGLDFPETRPADDWRDLASDHGQWLVKSRHSSGGLGVRFATPDDLSGRPRHGYFQRYEPGMAASALFVAAAGRASLLGCSRQILGGDIGNGDLPFLYAGSIGPLVLSGDQASRLAMLGDSLATQFRLTGLMGIDFIVGESGRLYVVEVNPRYTASVEVLERATGMNAFALHAAACVDGTLASSVGNALRGVPALFAGKRILYARRDCLIPTAFDPCIRDWNRPGRQPAIADLPRIGDRIAAGQPIATTMADGETEADVENRLRDRCQAIGEVLYLT